MCGSRRRRREGLWGVHRRTGGGARGGTLPPEFRERQNSDKNESPNSGKIWRKKILKYEVLRKIFVWSKFLMAKFARIQVLDVSAVLKSVLRHSNVLLQSSSFSYPWYWSISELLFLYGMDYGFGQRSEIRAKICLSPKPKWSCTPLGCEPVPIFTVTTLGSQRITAYELIHELTNLYFMN